MVNEGTLKRKLLYFAKGHPLAKDGYMSLAEVCANFVEDDIAIDLRLFTGNCLIADKFLHPMDIDRIHLQWDSFKCTLRHRYELKFPLSEKYQRRHQHKVLTNPAVGLHRD